MDLFIVVAILMLVVWAVGTFVLALGGWIHLLLTAGLFLLIHRIVVRGTPNANATPNVTSNATPPRANDARAPR